MERYSEYKDSGVQWLGEIPSHWEVKHLRNFLTLFSDKGHGDKQLLSVTREKGVILRDKDNKEENHNFVPDDLSGYKHLYAGDFVINKMKSWQGSYGVSEYEGIVSPAYFTCKLRGVDPKFFSRAIRSKAYIGFFMQYSKGIRVDQWDLDPNSMKDIPFVLPTLPEQQAISNYLDSATSKIDEAIAQQQKMIDLLNERKQIIINNAVTKGLDPNVKMKDSGVDWIGEIPEHWEVAPIKRFVDVRDGTHDTPFYLNQNDGEAYPLVTSKDFVENEISYSDVKWISKSDFIEIDKRSHVEKYDVLTSMIGGNIGKSIMKKDFTPIAIKNVALFRCKGDEYLAKFILYYMQGGFIKTQVDLLSRGGAQAFLGLTDMRNLVFFDIPRPEMMEIVDYIEMQTLKVTNLSKIAAKQISLLQERKQIIINDVVTGKVKVS